MRFKQNDAGLIFQDEIHGNLFEQNEKTNKFAIAEGVYTNTRWQYPLVTFCDLQVFRVRNLLFRTWVKYS